MANEEHLEILRQGVEVWNRWREENPRIRPDLRGADLRNLRLNVANLSRADLRKIDLTGSILRNGNLFSADLSGADLRRVDLRGTDLTDADLTGADFIGAILSETNFSQATVGWTTFARVDLRKTKGLDTLKHSGPSAISIDTIYLSEGQIPEVFLRGVGVDDTFINYIASFTSQPIQYYSCFISHSSKDEGFAKRLHADLQQNNVCCWFAPEDMKIGDKIRPRIDESIRIHDKLLLILSEHAINSTWVETEVERAFAEERKRKQTVLFPVRLDDAVMTTDQAWATHIRHTRYIGNFSRWKDHDAYQQAFERLLRDLKAED